MEQPKKIQKYAEVEREKIVKIAKNTLWSEEGKDILNFLKEKRNISESILEKFNIGYCPRGVNHDLSGRIIMPIYDSYNELIAITTRDFENEYYSHWHESFDKSNYLYGLNIAKDKIRKNGKAIIVEGQFDVMCLHSYGLTMAVGTIGTAFTPIHLCNLARYCSEIYFIFDPDDGGRKGIKKCREMYNNYFLHNYDMNFYDVILPDNLDPDDFIVQRGVQELFKIMKQTKEKQNDVL